jgi:hypothetical protein
VLNTIKECGLRTIISKGSIKLERTEHDQDIFWIGDCPHGKLHASSRRWIIIESDFRMALSKSFYRDTSWGLWNDSLRSSECSAHDHHSILRRVSFSDLGFCRIAENRQSTFLGQHGGSQRCRASSDPPPSSYYQEALRSAPILQELSSERSRLVRRGKDASGARGESRSPVVPSSSTRQCYEM